MSKKRMTYFVIAIVAAGVVWFGWKMTSRNGYESAVYTVVETAGQFEIREYPDLMLVTTTANFESQGNDGSFGRLFQYISGGNESSSKVSMTTPVFMEPEAEDSEGQMSFLLPAGIAASKIPVPSNDRVKVEKRSGGKFAVLQFSGQINEQTKNSMEEKLRQWIEAKGFSDNGTVEFAGYDPPWTPGLLRRNEVLIRLS